MKVCIIIPMYNEEEIAKNSIETIISYTKKIPPVVTVLVVNDGSQDATGSIVAQVAKELKDSELQLLSHRVNQGYGAALMTGIHFAIDNNYDYALFMDSDLTNHPKYLQSFYEKMIDGYDYIKATRRGKDCDVVGVPLQHKILSAMGNMLAKILYGLPLTDLTNGFRAVKVDILKKMNLTEPGFPIIMEELYYAKSLAKTFCDVPYILTSRGDQQGRSKFSYGPRTYYQYLKYALKSFVKMA